MDMFIAIASICALAIVAPWIYPIAGRATGALLSLLPFSLTAYFSAFAPHVASGQSFSVKYSWVPSLDVQLSFYLDGLTLLFALLITFIGGLVLIYTAPTLKDIRGLGRRSFCSSLGQSRKGCAKTTGRCCAASGRLHRVIPGLDASGFL
jgi:multicomponent Na+:H+ antiporter subunit A